MEINLTHRVPLVPAARVESCWAAAATMLHGGARPRAAAWPTPAPTDPVAADTIAAVPRPTHVGAGTLAQFARVWSLELLAPRDWDVPQLADSLARHPLWAGAYRPNGHAMVLTGMLGDGSPGGTYLTALDPLPAPTGAVLRLPFSVFAERYSLRTMHLLYRPALNPGNRSGVTQPWDLPHDAEE